MHMASLGIGMDGREGWESDSLYTIYAGIRVLTEFQQTRFEKSTLLVYPLCNSSRISGILVNEPRATNILTTAKPDNPRKGPFISERCDHHQRRDEGLGHVAT
jgi:hypothetical protein